MTGFPGGRLCRGKGLADGGAVQACNAATCQGTQAVTRNLEEAGGPSLEPSEAIVINDPSFRPSVPRTRRKYLDGAESQIHGDTLR